MSEPNPPGDPFEFLKRMWGPMGQSLPGMVTPTLNVGEVEKRIAELKSVENWLAMNLNMLKMTIQGLEMQRSTLAAFHSMNEAAQKAAQQATQNANESLKEAGSAAQAGTAPWPWNMMPQAAAPEPPATPKEGESDPKQ